MGHEFEVREEIELAATPEQVWAAIATGPGVDSWFMGRNEIEAGEGGRNRMTILGHTEESKVIGWEPGRRFALRGEPGADGTFMAFEYLLEGRDGGSTVLRFVHNGILADDWEDQYDALSVGDRAYLRKLAVYLKHFIPRTAGYNLFLPGPRVTDKASVWAEFGKAIGADGAVAEGDRVRLAVPGLPETEGVVEIVREPSFLGFRTEHAMYMFIHGYQDAVVLEAHDFGDPATETTVQQALTGWMASTFG